jgi:hypothetical protein
VIKRTWFYIFVASVILAGGVTVFAANESIEYKNKKQGYSLRVPAAWEIKESDGGLEVTVTGPLQGKAKDQFRPNVKVSVENVPHDMTLDKYVHGPIEKARTQMKSFKVHRIGRQVVSHTTARWWSISYAADTVNIKGILLIVVKNDKAFTITYVSAREQYSSYSDQFQNIVGSLMIE